MDKELHEAKDTSFHLSHQIENSENLVKKKEVELLAMEKRLKASETLNTEFCRAIEELKMEQEESRRIKEDMDRRSWQRQMVPEIELVKMAGYQKAWRFDPLTSQTSGFFVPKFTKVAL
ncbi:hypothetical protein HN51_010978 [Arachis hypogaea]